MKIAFFALFLSLSVAAPAVAQFDVWRSQNPPTIPGNLKAVQMISQYTTYAVGEYTTFVSVSDSGWGWAIQTGIAPKKDKRFITLNALSFIDSMTGFAVGSGLVLKTIDAGKTWSIITISGPSRYTGVLMMSKDIAIIVGDNNLITRTTNGGATWKSVPLESVGLLTSIKKVREDFIVITADKGFLLFSPDSGKTWSSPPIWTNFGNTVNSVAFENENKAVCVGELGFLAMTTDQGGSWKRHAWDTAGLIVSNDLNSIDVRSPGHYVAVGNYGTIVYSSDGGLHWNKGVFDIFLTSGLALNGVWMWNKDYGYAVGDLGTLIRTTDGGANWNFIPQDPLFARLYGIAYPRGDSSHGIAVGAAGTVLITSDGGTNWETTTSPVFDIKTDLFSVAYADSRTAFACGSNGKIFKTADYGASWIQDSTPTNRDLHSICFVDSAYGWASGDFNTLLQTKTGGREWYHIFNSKPKDTITCVSFCDRMNGVSALNYTTDGGFSWDTIPIPRWDTLFWWHTADNEFRDYWGFGRQSHIVAPGHFVLIGSVDNGHQIFGTIVTYIGDSMFFFGDKFTTPFIWFKAIDFADSLHGTVVGSAGTIYYTSNGGRTWELQESSTSLDLWAVNMPLTYVATTSGIRGTIFKHTNTNPLASAPEHSASINSTIEIVSAYPNPAQEFTSVIIQLSRAMPLELRIYNQLGTQLKAVDLGMQTEGEFEIPISFLGLSNGSYILELRSADQMKHIQIKIVK